MSKIFYSANGAVAIAPQDMEVEVSFGPDTKAVLVDEEITLNEIKIENGDLVIEQQPKENPSSNDKIENS